RFNVVVLIGLLCGIAFLTARAVLEDRHKDDYHRAVTQADKDADRVVDLAGGPTGIGETGAVALLRNDAKTQGPRLFSRYCARCHRYEGHDGTGRVPDPAQNPQSASDLKGFASRAWLSGLLNPD